ncbi:hypothetical protein K443DRAFT_125639 [Laccaria amethystina LaAM-08-1]|uniref:Uncharacterized protein n=1 Tax=Laccaria amethystina LaAM-08-1 TaxID=1095629 RepID=A0A0C9WIQ0_9AGAR|nr:hypothetical protein K443DRAFT_125639 [Laccaria amethystina LaAM-08-1]
MPSHSSRPFSPRSRNTYSPLKQHIIGSRPYGELPRHRKSMAPRISHPNCVLADGNEEEGKTGAVKTWGRNGEDDGVSVDSTCLSCFWSISPPEDMSHDQPAKATILDGKLCWTDGELETTGRHHWSKCGRPYGAKTAGNKCGSVAGEVDIRCVGQMRMTGYVGGKGNRGPKYREFGDEDPGERGSPGSPGWGIQALCGGVLAGEGEGLF